MRFIDISQPLEPTMHTYPGDTPFSRKETQSLRAGDPVTLSELIMSAHAGTHVDAPCHCTDDERTVTDLDPAAFSGPAIVLDRTSLGKLLKANDLEPFPIRPGDIVLLKTRNSDRVKEEGGFFEDYVYLSENGARYLVEQQIKAVGIDYLSIEGFNVKGYPAHTLLLAAGIGIIEGLNLAPVQAGRYWLFCLPLKVVGGDGAPARAVLVEESAIARA